MDDASRVMADALEPVYSTPGVCIGASIQPEAVTTANVKKPSVELKRPKHIVISGGMQNNSTGGALRCFRASVTAAIIKVHNPNWGCY